MIANRLGRRIVKRRDIVSVRACRAIAHARAAAVLGSRAFFLLARHVGFVHRAKRFKPIFLFLVLGQRSILLRHVSSLPRCGQ